MKKILALILSLLMIVTACIGFVTVSLAASDPVVLYDGLTLSSYEGYCTRGDYISSDGCARFVWYNQGTSVDPQLHLLSNTAKTVAPYMVIKYRTLTAGLKGAAYIGNGDELSESSKATWDYSTADGTWGTVTIYLPDAISGYYNLSDNQIKNFRFEVVEDGYTETPGEWLDIAYIAFFNTEEDATNYEYVKPVDPDAAAGGSYLTYDFTTATDLSTMLGEPYQMNAALVDGALRITATGADPYAKLLVNGSDQLGISGKQARYILVKYKTSATNADGSAMQMKFFSNVDGYASWGQPGSYTNGDNLTSDGNWHYVMIDASGAWGLRDNSLNAFRIDALDACAVGDSIDIASIKFFTTTDWAKTFVVDLVETDTAAKELALAMNWIAAETDTETDTDTDTETETEPTPDPEPTVLLGDSNGDGLVNSKDLARLQKFLAGATNELDMEAADVTVDGTVNSKDLARFQKFLAGAAQLG